VGGAGKCGIAAEASYPIKGNPTPVTPLPIPASPAPPPPSENFCEGYFYCQEISTCCCVSEAGKPCNSWACCPYENATCCADNQTCCPKEYPICDLSTRSCLMVRKNHTCVIFMGIGHLVILVILLEILCDETEQSEEPVPASEGSQARRG